MSADGEEYFNFKATGFADKLSLYVRALFESKQNCDCVIFGENDGKVRAHRLILDATIPGLITLADLQNGTGNNRGNGVNDNRNAMLVYRLPLKIQTIMKIVKFCYTGEITIGTHELMPLLMFAIKYNVKEVVEVCLNRLKQSIDPANFKQVVQRLNRTNDVSEQRTWREIICSNFLKVSKYPTFGDITMDQFVNIIRSPDLRNIREEEVFSAFQLWLNQPNNVSAHLDIGSMLTHIRFPLMNPKFFSENVEKFLEQFNRKDLIIEYYKWQLTQRKQIDRKSEECNERMSLRDNDLVVLSHTKNNKLLMQIVPPQPGKPITSREIAELQFMEYNSIARTNDGKLIISGGVDKHENNLSTVTCFNLETMEVIEYPGLQTPRSLHASTVINDEIFMAGGYLKTKTLSSVEKFCPMNKKWLFVKPMIHKRMGFSLVAVNGFIFALGGREFDNTTMLNSVERYDQSLNVWTPAASMAYPRACLSAVAHNNNIYVFGGAQKIKDDEENTLFSDYTDKVERYNIAADSWSTIYTLDTALIDIASCLYGEYIILVGGFDEKKKEDVRTIQSFDTERLDCTYMNALEEGVSCDVAFPAPMDLVEKLKERQMNSNHAVRLNSETSTRSSQRLKSRKS